jgi:acetyl-CoA carboxylase biotin carboxyl carrier protein
MTDSNSDRVRQLSDWLSGTDIACLELRGPGESICLRREGGRIVVAQGEPALTPVDAPSVAATAASVGVFLHRHPLRDTAIAETGTAVRRGQIVGLLQIGALLLPVTSPCDGVVAAILLEHGATAGYGARLVEIHPIAAAA